ncbi:hypothetical protein LXL04_032191 [Taraxacum kok-saghyz]
MPLDSRATFFTVMINDRTKQLRGMTAIEYNGVNFEWLPFGGGRRKCPGAQFSVAMMELALANLVYKFDFTSPENKEVDMSEKYGLSLHMKNSLMVMATPRAVAKTISRYSAFFDSFTRLAIHDHSNSNCYVSNPLPIFLPGLFYFSISFSTVSNFFLLALSSNMKINNNLNRHHLILHFLSTPPHTVIYIANLKPRLHYQTPLFYHQSSTKSLFGQSHVSNVELIPSKRSISIKAQYNDNGRSNSGNAFVVGFVLGGLIIGTLGCVYAPQKQDSSLNSQKGKTRKKLMEKITQLNDAIDDLKSNDKVSSRNSVVVPEKAQSSFNKRPLTRHKNMEIFFVTIFSSLQTFISLFLLIMLMNFFRIKWISFHSKTTKNFPPSLQKLPIIGNFHQLGPNPNQSLQVLSQKHGPFMLLHFGSIPMLVASSAEAAREILKTHDISFCSRPSLTIPNILLYDCKDIAFAPYGESWRQLKSTVVVHLLSNTRVKSFRQVREKEISRMIGVLQESGGSLVDMGSLIASLTNNIICRVAVGRAFDGPKVTDLLNKFLDMFTVFSVGSFIPWLSWVDRLSGLEGNAKKIAKEIDEFLEDIIEEHLVKKKCVGDENEVQDLVDILLDVQRDNAMDFHIHRDTLKALILNMFAAGTDTTSTSLQWTISELIKHPKVMKKLQQEVTQTAKGRSMIVEEDLEKMHYLKAVIKESLRLHPPVPLLVPRISMEDVKLNGYDIPKGTQVIINAWAIGRDPEIWEESEEFRPERFLNNSIDYNGVSFEWLPFGGGRRKCPGIPFGVVLMELALANLVYNFDFMLPENEELDMSEKYGIILHMKSPLMVMASPRVVGTNAYLLDLIPKPVGPNFDIRCTHRKNRKNFHPSPRKLPIIGNFHQLGSSPYHSLHILSQKHGPLMLLHFGSIPMLVASSPSSAHEILKTHDLSFSSRPSLTIPNILFYEAKDIAFSPYGEFWRQLKSTVVVHMLSNTQVKSFRQVREKEISRMIGVLEESGGSLVDMGSLLMSLTNNIICRVAVGRTYDDSKLTDLMIKYLNMLTCFSVGSFIPLLSWVDRLSGLEKNARKIAKECDEFLEDVVEEHLKKKTCVGDANEVQDFNFHRDTLKGVILVWFKVSLVKLK